MLHVCYFPPSLISTPQQSNVTTSSFPRRPPSLTPTAFPPPMMRSRFSHTCTLLSQYIKEKGALGINITARAPDNNAHAPTHEPTMDLLRGIGIGGGSAASLPDLNSNAAAAGRKPLNQMTIFYGGEVIVFDDFPAEKAKELVAMATEWSSRCSAFGVFPLGSAAAAPASPAQQAHHDHVPVSSDLPIARRVSLNRFLEKRKDRISSKAPYQVPTPRDMVPPSSCSAPPPLLPPMRAEDGKLWIGLGPNSPGKEEEPHH